MPKDCLFRWHSFGTILVVLFGWANLMAPALGDEPKKSGDARSQQFLLTGQEPAEPLVPLNPRTLDDTRRLEAIKQFCVGCRLENQYQWNDAIAAYRKALENDPKSSQIYRALIKSCRAARRLPEAEQYLEEAASLDPLDYELLAWLGESKEEKSQLESAVRLYKQALASPKLDKRQPIAVVLKLKLGLIHEQNREYVDSAGYYSDVMEAMERTSEFGLNMLEVQPQFLRNRVETYERFSNVFRQAKKYDDSLRALRLAQAVQPRSTRFSLNIAEVYIDQEKFAQALEYLEKYLAEQTPQGSPAYERLAFVLGKLGRADEVLPRVVAAAEKDRFNVGLQSFLGSLYEEAGDIEKAKEIYLPLLKNSPDPRVYKSMARIYLKEDRFRDLILLLGAGLERQVDGRPGAVDAVAEQMKVLSDDPQTAKRVVETAREMFQEDPKLVKFFVRYFVAQVARDAKMYTESIEFYRHCLEVQPKAAGLFRELALVQVYAGQTADAIKSGQEALDLEPNDVRGHYIFAQILSQAGKYVEAAEKFEQILRDFADNDELAIRVRYILSNIYTQLGQMAKAEKSLEEILEKAPDDETANNDLGYLWADQGKNLEQAEKMIRKALERYASREREPNEPAKNAAYLDSMGWVLYKLGRPEEALKYLEEAVAERDGNDDATIVDHLGDVHLRLNQPAQAKAMWLKAKETLENAKGPRRDDKRLKEINEKLKSFDDPKNINGETRREK
jgi:tetratricopeptide (TPR) repeat protein